MADLNTSISPAPVVLCITKGAQSVTSFDGNVTMSLGDNPTLATLGGTTTVAAVAGVATFSDLTLDRSGKDFTLVATAEDIRSVQSRPFSIPTRLVFTTQPQSGYAPDEPLPTIVVTAQDSAGNTDTSYEGEVTISLWTGAGNGILGGFTTRLAINGVAEFSGISIDEGGAYSLRAEAAEVDTAFTPAQKISDTFYISGFVLEADQVVVPGVITTTGYSVIDGLGSLTPTTYSGVVIVYLLTIDATLPSPSITTGIVMAGNQSQSFFTSLIINGGTPLLSAAATYAYDSMNDRTSWSWASNEMTLAASYAVTIIP